MRVFAMVLAGALALAGCSGQTTGPTSPPVQGFTLQVVSDGADVVYLVTHSDGRAVAARTHEGASQLVDVADARQRVDAQLGVMGPSSEAPVSVRLPGFEFSIVGQDHGENGDRVRIALNTGGKEVLIDAEDTNGDDHGTAEAAAKINDHAHINIDDADRAVVRIGGASEAEARDFINDADDLSAETTTQMLTALHL